MKQITVVTKNRPGLAADLTETLGARGINIENLTAGVVGEIAVFLIIVDRYDEALAALRDASFEAVSEDALVVRIPNEPGALAKVARRFTDAGIALRSMRIIRRIEGWGLVAISTDRITEARRLVQDLLIGTE